MICFQNQSHFRITAWQRLIGWCWWQWQTISSALGSIHIQLGGCADTAEEGVWSERFEGLFLYIFILP